MSRTIQVPWNTAPALITIPPDPDPADRKAKPKGRRPASVIHARTHTRTAPDWLYHHLTVHGPLDGVDAFAAAARGSGITPWPLDASQIEEDIFIRAVSQPASQRNLTVEGCRILARQFREQVEAHHVRAMALVGHSQACPFDLHALLPVPAFLLRLGPTHPDTLAWLAAQWGLTDRLRQVSVRDKATAGRRLPRGHAVIGYGFFTAGETPQAAIASCETRWPALRFSLVPRPAD